jgi:hypothetical protein
VSLAGDEATLGEDLARRDRCDDCVGVRIDLHDVLAGAGVDRRRAYAEALAQIAAGDGGVDLRLDRAG